jgi:hypothetical protein
VQVNPLHALVRRLEFTLHLQVLWTESCSFPDAGEHARPQFFIVVKGEYNVRPAGEGKRAVRTGLPLNGPADSKKR